MSKPISYHSKTNSWQNKEHVPDISVIFKIIVHTKIYRSLRHFDAIKEPNYEITSLDLKEL